MKTIDLIQGSPEWHAHRATHFNASDAPAMMGCSKYKTRTQLLHELKTGIVPEVDPVTQRRFDDGHRFEALERPFAAQTIGEDLYPVVGSEGELSASFDGLTMAEDIAWEHKTLNNELRAAMTSMDGAALPLAYRVQMEQQCMVSGCEKVLFTATKWSGDELVERREAWYLPDLALRAEIAAGWRQFAADLAAYVPGEKTTVAVAQPVEALPALVIRVEGRVLSSNLDLYREAALARIEAVKTILETDQDFADAEATAKSFKEGADNLKQAKLQAQSEAESIDAVFRAVDYIVGLLDAKRLELGRLVKNEKERRRGDIVADGVTGLRDHINALNARIGKPYMPAIQADFGGAIKGKKNLDSMKDAVDVVLTSSKIEASVVAERIEANLKHLATEAADHTALFPDEATIVLKAADDFKALVQLRIADFKAKEDKRKADELAKAAVVVEPVAAPAAAPAPAVFAMPMRTAPRAAAPMAHPTLSLGQIKERIAPLSITAEGMATLGFTGLKERGSVLFHEAEYPHILAAMANHLQAIHAKQAA